MPSSSYVTTTSGRSSRRNTASLPAASSSLAWWNERGSLLSAVSTMPESREPRNSWRSTPRISEAFFSSCARISPRCGREAASSMLWISPTSPRVAVMSTTRWPCALAFIIPPPVEMASSSGCAWTRSSVPISLTENHLGQLFDSTVPRAGDGVVRGGDHLGRRSLDGDTQSGPADHGRVVAAVADRHNLLPRDAKTPAQEFERGGLVALDARELEVLGHRRRDVQLPCPSAARVRQQRLEPFGGRDDDELGRGRPHRPVQVAHDVDLHAGVLRVLVCLRAIARDDQRVVAVRLNVQVALLRVADDLHGQVVPDAMVEQHAAIERPDLGALVADDRPLEAQAFHPRHRARERAAGAGDHGHAPRHDAEIGRASCRE